MRAPPPRALLGMVLCLTAGCSTSALPSWLPLTGASQDERRARRPAGEVREETRAPRAVPDRGGLEGAGDPAEALYRLGLLQADPTSGIRDYRAARATFTRLLSEYPRSRWEAEARAWQATLTDLLVREDQARRALLRLQRSEEEGKRTKANLQWLRETEIELERRK
ncbi:MAG: tol-pal system YbgF family protein [Candidatus Rokuibacteriota bacterium]|jgi:TolA-binding protein